MGRNSSKRAIYPLFHNIFKMSQITYSFVKCGCSLYFPLNSEKSDMLRHGYLEVFQRIHWDNEIRLYITICFFIAEVWRSSACFAEKIRLDNLVNHLLGWRVQWNDFLWKKKKKNNNKKTCASNGSLPNRKEVVRRARHTTNSSSCNHEMKGVSEMWWLH